MEILLNAFYTLFLLFGLAMPIWNLVSREKFGNLKSEIERKKTALEDFFTLEEELLMIINKIASVLVIVGLFTSQWILFLLMIILSIINRIFIKDGTDITFSRIRSFVYLIIILFIGLNHFHFKIDLIKLILNN